MKGEAKIIHDKSAWGDGPWTTEPDYVQWEHAGMACIAVRNINSGNWCGYAAVPPGHPFYGKDYDAPDVEVHGGLTYSAKCRGHICHVPKPGDPDDVWWFGFDCAHYGDMSPAYESFRNDPDLGGTYKTIDYVQEETDRLAEQLSTLGK